MKTKLNGDPRKKTKVALGPPGFARWLQNKRGAAGLSQVELGEAADVSKSSVAGWERGTSRPRGYRVDKLAGALGLSVADVRAALGEQPDRSPVSEMVWQEILELATAIAHRAQAALKEYR